MSFDEEVKIGEVRVFADTKEPLVAAVIEARGLAGWRIVPVSPYRAAVADNELEIGERVFQLWNACTASRKFVTRSWVADTLAPSDLGRLRSASASAKALVGRLGEYERRTLAAGGDFAGWQSKFPTKKRTWIWPTVSWAAAAMVLISLGAFYLLPEMGPREESDGNCVAERAMAVQMVREERVPDLLPPEPSPAEPEPMLAAADVDLRPHDVEVPKCEPAPRVSEPVEAAKLASVPKARLKAMGRSAVVARKAALPSEERVSRSLAELKAMQNQDGSWGQRPLKDTALAVLAMMASGETADSKEYGPSLVAGVRFLTEAELKGAARQDVLVAACALCCATTAVRNPNIRTAAEKALASIGDKRSVEAGRDWIGILADLAKPLRKTKASHVASEPPERDRVAETSILVLQLLLSSED